MPASAARENQAPPLRIGRYSAPLGQHAPIHELRIRNSLGGPAQPLRCLLLVLVDTDALHQADAEVVGSDEIALGGGLLEPSHNPAGVLRIAGAFQHEIGQVHLGRRIAALGRGTQPARRFLFVSHHAGAGEVERTQSSCGGSISRVGSAAVPVRCLGIIRRHRPTLNIEVADQGSGLRIGGESWLRRAALAGDPEAAALIGNLYTQNGSVPPNYSEAANWYKRAAEAGHVGAARALGSLYLTGAGVAQDNDEATRWFGIAAEAGDPASQVDLANLVLEGGSTSGDRGRIAGWFEKPALVGDLTAGQQPNEISEQ